MTCFHALAHMGIEAVVITSPETPYVSIGYFQDAEKSVDLEKCKELNLPVIKREIGGGTVLLDKDQVFFHLILHKKNPLLPLSLDEIYQKFSIIPIRAYEKFGIKTKLRPVNDILTLDNKKISGLGGANIGDYMVFVGSLLMDFDFKTMTQVLRVPDEKFRDKVYKTMQDNMTTMKLELGEYPLRAKVEEALIASFKEILGEMEPAGINTDIKEKMQELEALYTSEEFIMEDIYQKQKALKIKSGIYIGHGNYKAPGGLISTSVVFSDESIISANISGDFTMYPKERLEQLEDCLKGVKKDMQLISHCLEKTMGDYNINILGVSADDLAMAINAAIN